MGTQWSKQIILRFQKTVHLSSPPQQNPLVFRFSPALIHSVFFGLGSPSDADWMAETRLCEILKNAVFTGTKKKTQQKCLLVFSHQLNMFYLLKACLSISCGLNGPQSFFWYSHKLVFFIFKKFRIALLFHQRQCQPFFWPYFSIGSRLNGRNVIFLRFSKIGPCHQMSCQERFFFWPIWVLSLHSEQIPGRLASQNITFSRPETHPDSQNSGTDRGWLKMRPFWTFEIQNWDLTRTQDCQRVQEQDALEPENPHKTWQTCLYQRETIWKGCQLPDSSVSSRWVTYTTRWADLMCVPASKAALVVLRTHLLSCVPASSMEGCVAEVFLQAYTCDMSVLDVCIRYLIYMCCYTCCPRVLAS